MREYALGLSLGAAALVKAQYQLEHVKFGYRYVYFACEALYDMPLRERHVLHVCVTSQNNRETRVTTATSNHALVHVVRYGRAQWEMALPLNDDDGIRRIIIRQNVRRPWLGTLQWELCYVLPVDVTGVQ